MDSALSIWFLLLWLGGDTCNLVGSFLADQLPLQVTMLSDVILFSLSFSLLSIKEMVLSDFKSILSQLLADTLCLCLFDQTMFD